MFDPRPLCCSSLTTAVGGTTDTNFVDSAHPTVARIKYYGLCFKVVFGSFVGFVNLHHHIKLGIEISLIYAEFG